MAYLVLCPKAVLKILSGTYYGSFVFRFLKKMNFKAVIPNECWEALKFRLKEKYNQRFDQEEATKKADSDIARIRSWLEPENPLLDKYGRDILPSKNHDNQVLIDKTIDLVNRKWQIINYFIGEENHSFEETKIKPKNVDDFLNFCLEANAGTTLRIIAEEFIKLYPIINEG